MIPSIQYNIPYIKPIYGEEELSEKEFYHKLFFQSHNWKHRDGRINATKLSGEYVAATISPYYKDFQSQIEDKVWPAVSLLVNKGYLPISSCEGHGGKSPYYIMLAFGDEELLNNFILLLKSKVIKGLEWSLKDTVANIAANYNSGNVNFQKYTLEGNDDKSYYRMEVRSLNNLFARNYLNYKFIRVTLFDQTHIPNWRWIKLSKSNRNKKKYLESSISQLEQLFKKLDNV